MPVTWTVTPEAALSDLSDAQAKAIYQAVHALVESYAPVVQAYMNDSIPWHTPGVPDISEEEPHDMYAWVETVTNQVVTMYLGHDAMANPEKTLYKELEYALPAMDYFGPQIMADIRAMLGGG